MMSESQAIQSIMNAELEVYRQKGRVLELEADNSALRADLERHGMEFTDDYGGRWQGDVVTGHINALRQHIKQLESNAANLVDRNKALRTECVEAQQERDALRLKVQGLDRTLADVYAQRDGLQRDLTTLETLVNTVHHELVALFPQPKDPTLDDARAICRNRNAADAQCLYNAYNALLTHRQGMGG